ncbi:MAG: helix-turn-helix transcriptional regulator [Acidobacteria bacterium]|nr:helix-turn-helix transcriptional regulator [Acidobacteriota bacterium]
MPPPAQLRKARGLTQETVAELLGVSQAEVSKTERRSELYIGTLKDFILVTILTHLRECRPGFNNELVSFRPG